MLPPAFNSPWWKKSIWFFSKQFLNPFILLASSHKEFHYLILCCMRNYFFLLVVNLAPSNLPGLPSVLAVEKIWRERDSEKYGLNGGNGMAFKLHSCLPSHLLKSSPSSCKRFYMKDLNHDRHCPYLFTHNSLKKLNVFIERFCHIIFRSLSVSTKSINPWNMIHL